jgi:hypothetical protein
MGRKRGGNARAASIRSAFSGRFDLVQRGNDFHALLNAARRSQREPFHLGVQKDASR